ncbi:hypothetical protein BKA69DRAFT_141922 [Paraphysoderma sedebokerense]|nr:hypothetical protein BKA69DRAFT_141922 [Paraphysoderma sedebokerense]
MFTLSMTMKTSCCFLITAFFNHLSQSIVQGGFMSSREFKAYQAYGIFSLIAYPVLTAPLQRIDQVMSAILPQLFYSTECMILTGLCLYNNYRLKKLVKNASGKGTIQNKSSERISFYLLANNLMAICVFVEGISLYMINIDTITTMIIYKNKFATDILTKTFSLGFTCCYPLIFHMLFLAPQADGPTSAQQAGKSGSHLPPGTGHHGSTIGLASGTQSAAKIPANQSHTKLPPLNFSV